MTEKTTESRSENILQELNAFITETKILVEKVMIMRVQSMEAQITLLRSFNPKCLEILETSNEISSRSTMQVRRNRRFATDRLNVTHMDKVRFQPELPMVASGIENN